MPNDNVIKLSLPGTFEDQLTEVLRQGAQILLAKAVEAEVAGFLAKHADLKTNDGLARVGRHGHLPERAVVTGIGPVAVRQPHVRDLEAAADDPGRIRVSPSILPPYMRRSKSIETLLPILDLNGTRSWNGSMSASRVEPENRPSNRVMPPNAGSSPLEMARRHIRPCGATRRSVCASIRDRSVILRSSSPRNCQPLGPHRVSIRVRAPGWMKRPSFGCSAVLHRSEFLDGR